MIRLFSIPLFLIVPLWAFAPADAQTAAGRAPTVDTTSRDTYATSFSPLPNGSSITSTAYASSGANASPVNFYVAEAEPVAYQQPNGYRPNGYQPNGYRPNAYQPNGYQPRFGYQPYPATPQVNRQQPQYAPNNFGSQMRYPNQTSQRQTPSQTNPVRGQAQLRRPQANPAGYRMPTSQPATQRPATNQVQWRQPALQNRAPNTGYSMWTSNYQAPNCCGQPNPYAYAPPAQYNRQPLPAQPNYAPQFAPVRPPAAGYNPYGAVNPYGATNPYGYGAANYGANRRTQWTPLIPLRALPAGTYVGQGLIGQPVAYVDGEPVRNFLRYLAP